MAELPPGSKNSPLSSKRSCSPRFKLPLFLSFKTLHGSPWQLQKKRSILCSFPFFSLPKLPHPQKETTCSHPRDKPVVSLSSLKHHRLWSQTWLDFSSKQVHRMFKCKNKNALPQLPSLEGVLQPAPLPKATFERNVTGRPRSNSLSQGAIGTAGLSGWLS